jgi:hypothetical protein
MVKKFYIYTPEDLMPCSQHSATEHNPAHYLFKIHFAVILSSALFPSVFPTNMLLNFSYQMCVTTPDNIILLAVVGANMYVPRPLEVKGNAVRGVGTGSTKGSMYHP